jgi:hypothetical protein
VNERVSEAVETSVWDERVCARTHARVCKSAFAKARVSQDAECAKIDAVAWAVGRHEGGQSQERVAGSPDTAILNGNDSYSEIPPFCTRKQNFENSNNRNSLHAVGGGDGVSCVTQHSVLAVAWPLAAV